MQRYEVEQLRYEQSPSLKQQPELVKLPRERETERAHRHREQTHCLEETSALISVGAARSWCGVCQRRVH